MIIYVVEIIFMVIIAQNSVPNIIIVQDNFIDHNCAKFVDDNNCAKFVQNYFDHYKAKI